MDVILSSMKASCLLKTGPDRHTSNYLMQSSYQGLHVDEQGTLSGSPCFNPRTTDVHSYTVEDLLSCVSALQQGCEDVYSPLSVAQLIAAGRVVVEDVWGVGE